MGALFENLSSGTENEDIVGFFDGLEAVGDDDDGFVLEEFAECLRDMDLRKAIKCARRLVEDEDLGVTEEYTSDREALAFSSGEADSLLSDEGIESIWEPIQEVTFRVCECDQEVIVGRSIGYPEDHIFSDRPVEYGWLLWEISNMWEIRIESESEEILPIDIRLTFHRLQESEEDFHDRTLPCPTASDESDFLPSFESGREIFHCIPTALRVGIAHILKNYIAFAWLEYLAIVQSLHILEAIEKTPESRDIGIVLGQCLILIEDGLEESIHDGKYESEWHDIPRRRGSASDIVPDKNNDDDPKYIENITCSPKHPDDFPLYVMGCLEDCFWDTHEEILFLFLTSGQENGLLLHRHACHDTIRFLHEFLAFFEERLCRFLFPDNEKSDNHHVSEHKWERFQWCKSYVRNPHEEEEEIQKNVRDKSSDECPPIRHSCLDDRQSLPDARMERGGVIDEEEFACNLSIYPKHHRVPDNRCCRVASMDEEEARRYDDGNQERNRRYNERLKRRFREREIGNLRDRPRRNKHRHRDHRPEQDMEPKRFFRIFHRVENPLKEGNVFVGMGDFWHRKYSKNGNLWFWERNWWKKFLIIE